MRRIPVLLAAILSFSATLAAQPREVMPAPDWSRLDPFQGGLSKDRLKELMDGLYAPSGDWRKWARMEEDGLWITRNSADPDDEYFFAFQGDQENEKSPAPPARHGLQGLRIALDPGHIGGAWGPMEERSFSIGDGRTVQEGDLTLATARRLRELLEREGAIVWLVRENTEPSTSLRPEDFMEEAEALLANRAGMTPEDRSQQRRKLAERLFYRRAEIRARAERLNKEVRPDLAIALHINAVAWVDPTAFSLTERNEGHVIVNGCYLADELGDDTMRFELFQRLAKGYHQVELRLAEAMARAMVASTGLPPYRYAGKNALQLDADGYVWARNLLANRIFDCPVVYLEPWIANSKAVYAWASMGDYEGELFVGGRSRPSLPAVYADFVLAGLLEYCAE